MTLDSEHLAALRAAAQSSRDEYPWNIIVPLLEDHAALSAGLLAAQEALCQIADESDCADGFKGDSSLVPSLKTINGIARALLGVSAEPLKDTDGATAKLSPVAEEGQS